MMTLLCFHDVAVTRHTEAVALAQPTRGPRSSDFRATGLGCARPRARRTRPPVKPVPVPALRCPCSGRLIAKLDRAPGPRQLRI